MTTSKIETIKNRRQPQKGMIHNLKFLCDRIVKGEVEPSKIKCHKKVEKVQRGGGVSTKNQKVQNLKFGLIDKRLYFHFLFPDVKCRL